MANVILPIWLFWTLIVFLTIFFLGCGAIWFYYWNKDRTDKVLMFDKNMRWELVSVNTKKDDTYNIGKKAYIYKDGEGFLSKIGKTLYVFTENNSAPLSIKKYNAEWLSPESLKGVINNKLVQMMVKPNDKFTDTMMLLGAIGGMIAGLASAVILLIQLGVI